MNKSRRKVITETINELETITQAVKASRAIEQVKVLLNTTEETLTDEEQYFEDMPENLQESDRGLTSSDAVDALERAIDSLTTAIEALEGVIGPTEETLGQDNSSDEWCELVATRSRGPSLPEPKAILFLLLAFKILT